MLEESKAELEQKCARIEGVCVTLQRDMLRISADITCCFCRLTGAKRRELDRNVALILVGHPHEVGTHAWRGYIRA